MGMTGLTLCSACNRHFRVVERACPFCGAASASGLCVPEFRLETRLGRSRAFSLGASLTFAGFVVSCEQTGGAVYGAPCNPPECNFPISGSGGAGAAGGDPSTGGTGSTGGGGGQASGGNAVGGVGAVAGSATSGTGGGFTNGSGGDAAGGDGAGGAGFGGAGGDLQGGAPP